MKISIISSSTRTGRISHRIALALQKAILLSGHEVKLVDLAAISLPPFEERIDFQKNPEPELLTLKEDLMKTDAFLFLSPEYNGAISSGLKNFIDVYAKAPFTHKAIGVVTGSTGAMGGIRAAYQLQQTILSIHGFPHPNMLTVGKMDQVLDEEGKILSAAYAENQQTFLKAFLDFAEKLNA
jgi:NAD(P)H-dependent FMN reductase